MKRRAAVQRTCDAPGCTIKVRSRILMCRNHWFATPKPLRDAINESWRAGRIREWSALCLEARTFHAGTAASVPVPVPVPVPSQRAFEMHARLLGERW